MADNVEGVNHPFGLRPVDRERKPVQQPGGDERRGGPDERGDAPETPLEMEHTLRELEVAEAEGRLMDYELGRRAWFELCREVRDRILLVPDRVAPLVLAATDLEDARRIVDEDLRAALSSLPERPPRGERGEDRHGE